MDNKDYSQESDINVISNLDMKQEDKSSINNNNGDDNNNSKNSYQSDLSGIMDEIENIDNNLGDDGGNTQVNIGNKNDTQSVSTHNSSNNNENANNRELDVEFDRNSTSRSNSNTNSSRNSMNVNGGYGNLGDNDNIQIADIPDMQYKNTLTIAQQYSALTLREEVDTIDSLDAFNVNEPFSTKEVCFSHFKHVSEMLLIDFCY